MLMRHLGRMGWRCLAEIMLTNMFPLVSVVLESHDEWCALKSHLIRVSVVVIRWSREGR